MAAAPAAPPGQLSLRSRDSQPQLPAPGASPHLAQGHLLGPTLRDGNLGLELPPRGPASPHSPRPAAGQPALTQSAAVQRLPLQLPLRTGATGEVWKRVVVHCFPQLARKISQSGTVQGGEEGIRSGVPSLPTAQRSK